MYVKLFKVCNWYRVEIYVFTWAWSNAPFVSLYLKAAYGFAASFVIVFPFWNGINGMVSCYWYYYLPLVYATDMITNKIFHNTLAHIRMRKENGKPHKIRRIPLCLLFSMTDEIANMFDFFRGFINVIQDNLIERWLQKQKYLAFWLKLHVKRYTVKV